MTRATRWAAAAAVALAVAAGGGEALANRKAEALSAKGKKQQAAKRYAEACKTLEQAERLAPGIGAKLDVAKCYEDWGRLARAHHWYGEAHKLALEGDDKRAAKIAERLAALDPEVPRLTIKTTPGADLARALIALDGEVLAVGAIGREQRVDPGPHEITYRSGAEKLTKTLALERGGERELMLDLLPVDDAPAPAKPAGPEGPEIERPGRPRRIAGIGLAGAGVVSFGVASYLAISASGRYHDALDAHCMGAANLCDDTGLAATRAARGRANVATVFTVASLALAAGGVVLYLTAPKDRIVERRGDDDDLDARIYVTPVLGPDGGGIVLGGRY